jgi:hypothetical protein
MRKEKANYSVSMMGRMLSVSRSEFYRWLKIHGDLSKKAIVKIWDASGRRFGFRKVCFRLMGIPNTADPCPLY